MWIGLNFHNVKFKSQTKDKLNLLYIVFLHFLNDSLKLISILLHLLVLKLLVILLSCNTYVDFAVASQLTFVIVYPSLLKDFFLASLASPILALLTVLFLYGLPSYSKVLTNISHSLCLCAYNHGSLGIFLSLYYYKCAEMLFMHGDIHPTLALLPIQILK